MLKVVVTKPKTKEPHEPAEHPIQQASHPRRIDGQPLKDVAEMKSGSKIEWLFVGVGSLMAAAALYFAATFSADLWKARASAEWPTVPGKVVMSEWGSFKLGAAPQSRGVWMKIRYSYQVAGREWEGSNVTIGNSMANADMIKVPAKYPAGSAVPVYYRAIAPADSVLEPGIHLAHFIVLLVPLLLGGMGLLFLWGGLYHLQREPTPPPERPGWDAPE